MPQCDLGTITNNRFFYSFYYAYIFTFVVYIIEMTLYIVQILFFKWTTHGHFLKWSNTPHITFYAHRQFPYMGCRNLFKLFLTVVHLDCFQILTWASNTLNILTSQTLSTFLIFSLREIVRNRICGMNPLTLKFFLPSTSGSLFPSG